MLCLLCHSKYRGRCLPCLFQTYPDPHVTFTIPSVTAPLTFASEVDEPFDLRSVSYLRRTGWMILDIQVSNIERALGSRQGGNKACVQIVTHSGVVEFDAQIPHLKRKNARSSSVPILKLRSCRIHSPFEHLFLCRTSIQSPPSTVVRTRGGEIWLCQHFTFKLVNENPIC